MRSVVSVLPVWPPSRVNNEEPEGSGVVIFGGRHVLTALHVVGIATSISLRTGDGRILPARLSGRDQATDLALLEIDEALTPIDFAGEATLGAPVCALGNAFGLGLSAACGVVSARHRAGVGFNPVEDFVQSDAAVNPGASGGALVDGDGRLAGLLSAIFTRKSDANIGVNFAVSAGLARKVATDLMDHGRVLRVSSGLRLSGFPPKGEAGLEAAQVVSLRDGSPAAAAGIEVRDRIVAADGRRIRKPADFVSVMALAQKGQSMILKVMRDNRELEMTLRF